MSCASLAPMTASCATGTPPGTALGVGAPCPAMAERVARTIAEYRAAAQNPSKDAASPAVQRALTMLTRKVAELESALRQSNQERDAALAQASTAQHDLKSAVEESARLRESEARRAAEEVALRAELREAGRVAAAGREAAERVQALEAGAAESRAALGKAEAELARSKEAAGALEAELRTLRAEREAGRDAELELVQVRCERDDAERRCRGLEERLEELLRERERERERKEREVVPVATDSAPPGVEERLRKAEAAVTLLEGAVETERASGKAGWDKVEALERSLAELRIQMGEVTAQRDAAERERSRAVRQLDEAMAARDVLMATNARLVARLERLTEMRDGEGGNATSSKPAAAARAPPRPSSARVSRPVANAPRGNKGPCRDHRALSAGHAARTVVRGPSESLMQPTASQLAGEGVTGADRRWVRSLRKGGNTHEDRCGCPECRVDTIVAREAAQKRSAEAVEAFQERMERARTIYGGCYCHPAGRDAGLAASCRCGAVFATDPRDPSLRSPGRRGRSSSPGRGAGGSRGATGASQLGGLAAGSGGAGPRSAVPEWARSSANAASPAWWGSRRTEDGAGTKAGARGVVGVSWQRAGSEAAGIIRELEQEYEALQTRYHVLATTIQRQGAGEALAEGASPEELEEVTLALELKAHQLAALQSAFGVA